MLQLTEYLKINNIVHTNQHMSLEERLQVTELLSSFRFYYKIDAAKISNNI